MSLWYVRLKPCTYLASRLALSPNGPKWASTWLHHLVVPSSASKMISESMVCRAQTMHLSCTDTNTISKQKEVRFHMTHITYEFHRVRQKWFLSLWFVRHKPCTYPASRLALCPNGQNELPLERCHLVVPSNASKTISEPMVRLVQTMHLSCTETNTISKWKEVKFHMTHVTKEFHRVRPKWFKSLWYVQHKLCSYLASRLTLSPNIAKWASTWASSPSGTIGCDQNDFWAYGTSSVNQVVPSVATKTISKPMVRLVQNHAPILHRR